MSNELLAGARKLKYRRRRLERPAQCSFCGEHLPAYAEVYCADRFPKMLGVLRLFACLACGRARGWRLNRAGVEYLDLNPADFAR
jgi:hypothetical protein